MVEKNLVTAYGHSALHRLAAFRAFGSEDLVGGLRVAQADDIETRAAGGIGDR